MIGTEHTNISLCTQDTHTVTHSLFHTWTAVRVNDVDVMLTDIGSCGMSEDNSLSNQH